MKSYFHRLSSCQLLVIATRRIQIPDVNVPSILKKAVHGQWARSEQKKSEIYARHLERVFLPNAMDSELDIVQCQQLNVTRKKLNFRSDRSCQRNILCDNLNC